MLPELTQVERYERAVGARTHADGSTGVQQEQRGTGWSELTENLDLAHASGVLHVGTLWTVMSVASTWHSLVADNLSAGSRRPDHPQWMTRAARDAQEGGRGFSPRLMTPP